MRCQNEGDQLQKLDQLVDQNYYFYEFIFLFQNLVSKTINEQYGDHYLLNIVKCIGCISSEPEVVQGHDGLDPAGLAVLVVVGGGGGPVVHHHLLRAKSFFCAFC